MPSPSTSLATLRPDLAGSLMEFDLDMDRNGFIAAQVLPVFEVAKQSGKFGRIPIEQLLQQRETLRAPGGGYNRGKWTFTTASFATEEHGAEEPVDDKEAEMYAEYFDAELVSAMRARDAVLRNAEKRVADLLFNATTFSGQETALTNEWDDKTNATPVDDVHAAKLAVWDRCGLWPNALVINRRVFLNLRLTDQMRDRIHSSGAGESVLQGRISVAQIAQALDLDFVFVAGSARNSATEGQSISIAPIWSNEYALVCRVATMQDIREPCLGRTMHWGQDGSTIGGTVESYRDETVRSDIVRCRHDVDEKTLYTEAGQLLNNLTT